MLKNQKGITLIALVITIIVLLILAGVSIAMLTGPNGLLTRANDSKTATIKAEAVERINTELQAQYANILAGKNFDGKTTIEGNINNDKVTVTATVNNPTTSGATDGTLSITVTTPTGIAANSTESSATIGIKYDNTAKSYKLTLAK